jgi:calcineurin-like phosphoesterase family protein
MIGLNRPFDSVEEMNDKIIKNFNDCLSPGDQVYFCGDLTWDKQIGVAFFNSLRRDIGFHFVLGNHDKKMWSLNRIHKNCASVQQYKDIRINEYRLFLCHYMMRSWNCSHYNSFHLFGHHHSWSKIPPVDGKWMPVACDIWQYRPVHFDEVLEWMKSCPDNWDLIRKEK